MADAILALNAGSSSIKFAMYRVAAGRGLDLAARGAVEGIGTAPRFTARDAAGATLADKKWPDGASPGHEAVLGEILDWLDAQLGAERLLAAGHRVVHGGSEFAAPVRVTAEVIEALELLTPLAPLHQPHSLSPIRAMLALRPGLPQIACFDTAFHRTMPPVAARFALPREYEQAGVRRYGFHGLSYEYIAQRLREVAPDLAAGRVIVAHLGNGASLCAMRDGRSIDTTMSFTALDGLVMGTRCGALDPGVVLYMLQQRGLSPDEVEDVLYRRSGLLGVSGVSSDMRALLASADHRGPARRSSCSCSAPPSRRPRLPPLSKDSTGSSSRPGSASAPLRSARWSGSGSAGSGSRSTQRRTSVTPTVSAPRKAGSRCASSRPTKKE